MKNRYKILPVPSWAGNKRYVDNAPCRGVSMKEFLQCVDEAIPPVFNRYGLYYDRLEKKCWVECINGCYLYSHGIGQMQYDIKLADHKPLDKYECLTLEKILKINILGRKVRQKILELLYLDKSWKDINSIQKNRMGVIKRFTEWAREYKETHPDFIVNPRKVNPLPLPK